MINKKILYRECIRIYQIEESFLDSLNDLGLIQMESSEQGKMITFDELEEFEQFIRWHTDMDINAEGIEAMSHMLKRVKLMQSEIIELQRELKFYRSL